MKQATPDFRFHNPNTDAQTVQCILQLVAEACERIVDRELGEQTDVETAEKGAS